MEVAPWNVPEEKRFDISRDWNGKNVLLLRAGGIGDLLFMTPALKKMRERWPVCRVTVACSPRYHDVFQGNESVSALANHPVEMETMERVDAVVNFEDLIEFGLDCRERHAVDLFAGELGLELGEDEKQIVFHLSEEERAWAVRTFPPNPEFSGRVGIQLHSSSPCRTYPIPLMQEVIRMLRDRGVEVFLFGQPGFMQMRRPMKGVRSLMEEQPPLTFRQSCAVLTTCSAVVAPDSALVHAGGALGLPVVALYGAFPWRLRTKYAPSVRAIAGKADCAPCFYHGRTKEGEPLSAFPEGKPCARTGLCEALEGISPRRIVRFLGF
jgi:ADP-heptose:LPS heptosyltransferase